MFVSGSFKRGILGISGVGVRGGTEADVFDNFARHLRRFGGSSGDKGSSSQGLFPSALWDQKTSLNADSAGGWPARGDSHRSGNSEHISHLRGDFFLAEEGR